MSPTLLWLCTVVPGLDDPGQIPNLESVPFGVPCPSLYRWKGEAYM